MPVITRKYNLTDVHSNSTLLSLFTVKKCYLPCTDCSCLPTESCVDTSMSTLPLLISYEQKTQNSRNIQCYFGLKSFDYWIPYF